MGAAYRGGIGSGRRARERRGRGEEREGRGKMTDWSLESIAAPATEADTAVEAPLPAVVWILSP